MADLNPIAQKLDHGKDQHHDLTPDNTRCLFLSRTRCPWFRRRIHT